jgi:hypothetical protein
MDFCDNRGVDFIFGLPGNPVLNRAVDIAADDIRARRSLAQAPVMRGYAETLYQAKSWAKARRACTDRRAHLVGMSRRRHNVVTQPIAHGEVRP